MSLAAREALVNSPNTIFQNDSQRDDLRDPNKTQTGLIALLSELISKGHILEFTAIKSDHHDDSDLGEHCHFNGYCADLWPLNTATAGDYVDAEGEKTESLLKDASESPWLYQIGLGGSADNGTDRAAAGPTCFSDNGADHIHLGAHN